MSEIVSREIRLKQRPVGMPKESDFEIVEVAIAAPKAGEVLVRNIYMSVDPYMRGVVRNVALGVPLEGGCVGQVVQSASGNRFKLEIMYWADSAGGSITLHR